MVLILTDKYDRHADIIVEKLLAEKIPFFRFDLDVESLKSTKVIYKNSAWNISNNSGSITSNDINCVWLRRPFVELTLEEQYDNSTDFKIWKNEWNKTLLGIYLDLKDANWLNPVRKSHKAENKYLQMKIAKEIGLKMPDIIISNYKDELVQFCVEHDDNVVLKLMSQEFYETKEGFKGLYVNKVKSSILKDFNNDCENPIVLQQYIDKAYEVRYTIVGDEHLVCKIDSQKSKIANIDWRRYDIAHTPHSQIEPPVSIKNKVNLLMKKLHIEYGALDFIVDKNNEWYFLEINSFGQWLWIEDLTGLKISDSIINWIKKNYRKEVV